ncbi:hypothetical protein [Sphingomonas glaciei]|uniref:Uncharacterized protein n=1 Tax=Sphingomonas glaciei TaxID=2938948 RepID=A0ABY5MTI2_9SPHN|nr:hypothetical protein [Sphingomonas glaciei]UUR07387.1 hypothetical protein M1K48_10600 [Sphingomonas glaciei]
MLELLGGLLLFFLLFTVLMVWLGIRLARNLMRSARGFAASFTQGVPGFSAIPDPRWARLASHLDRRQREQARTARERIAALLAERQSAALTPEEAQLMISCERRVPELIDTCLDRCRSARPNERCDYAAPTLERLVRIGEEAEAARSAIRARDDGRLLTMHNYFDTVAGSRDRGQSPATR